MFQNKLIPFLSHFYVYSYVLNTLTSCKCHIDEVCHFATRRLKAHSKRIVSY
jgi:hypothetical protein